MEFFQVKHTLTIQLSNPTPTYLPRKNENNVQPKTCMNIHNSQKIESNPNIHQLTSEEMNKLWYICIMKQHSAIKMNKLLIHKIT